MSHDIRTPMNAIIGFTSLAATHIDHKEQVLDYLKKISTSSQHLLSLINDVLDMSRIESGKVKIEEKAVHLPDLIHDVRSIIQPNVSAKRLSLFIDTMDVENEDIITDPLRLNQILLNILSNAIKFTPTGGMISIRISEKNGAPKGRACYEFRIKDNGIGMSEEFQKHIFEEFTREENSTVSGIQGTGLGMAITKKLVDQMHGSLDVESEPGKGSTFILRLSLPVLFGCRCAAPILVALAQRTPGLELEIDFDDRRVDVIKEGFDFVVRAGPLRSEAERNLVARKVADQRMAVCAAPAYLEAHGVPRELDDLFAHQCIVYYRSGRVWAWRFASRGPTPVQLTPPSRLLLDNYEAIADAAAAGFGLAWLPFWLVRDRIASGRLVQVLADCETPPADIYAVYLERLNLSAKVAYFVEHLRDYLSHHADSPSLSNW